MAEKTRPDYCTYVDDDEFCCDDCKHVDTRKCPQYENDYDGWTTDANARLDY